MARDKGRLDLRKDIRDALASHTELEPGVTAVLLAVLPHFELAYKRGVEAERSKAGYRATRTKEETWSAPSATETPASAPERKP
ncbi:hypothetical protein [Streptomyces agglomeratus]|uniref:hypothetical protein n=1 Tax=Streptomyces agglomeratus TaxID=285458 RepID=UPI00114CB7C4|nr:hypothetical protein [Streptomyces agglomeratus]